MASHPITTCSGSEGDKAVMSSLCGDLVCNSDESGFRKSERSERLKLSYIQKIILIGHHYERGLSVRDGSPDQSCCKENFTDNQDNLVRSVFS